MVPTRWSRPAYGKVGERFAQAATATIASPARFSIEGAVMTSRNAAIHRAGHEAFNDRDFEAMTKEYADRIVWTDHAQGHTFRTPQEFKDDFLPGWIRASSDIRVADQR